MMFGKIRIGKLIWRLVMVFAVTNHVSAFANTDKQDLAIEAPIAKVNSPVRRDMLDDRIRVLSQALNLDEAQQSELRKVLEVQREQLMKVWSDASLPAAYRIGATQAISGSTASSCR